MTTANKITILRVLLVPFFVVQMLYYVDTGNEWFRFSGLLSFVVAAISDGVDGYIARHYNQKSELGAVLDPLADKMLLVSGIVLLSFDHAPHLTQLPLHLTITVLSRDILLVVGLAVIHLACGKVRVRPILIGKAATVLQMASVIWILLKWPPAAVTWIAILATVTTGVSGIYYVLDGVRQLSASPSSAPSPKQ